MIITMNGNVVDFDYVADGTDNVSSITVQGFQLPGVEFFADDGVNQSETVFSSFGVTSVNVNGDDDNDVLTIGLTSNLSTLWDLGVSEINYHGNVSGSLAQGEDNELRLEAADFTGQDIQVIFVFDDPNSGHITIFDTQNQVDLLTINYDTLTPISSVITAPDVVLDFSNTAEVITIDDAIGLGNISVTSTAAESLTFATPTDTLEVNAGNTGDNVISFIGYDGTTANIALNGGNAADTVIISDAAGGSAIAVNTLGGDDVVGILAGAGDGVAVTTSAGNDTVSVSAGGSHTINTSSGEDSVGIIAGAGDAIVLTTGSDSDTVFVEGGGLHNINSGGGNDTISIDAGAGDTITVQGSLGDDMVEVRAGGSHSILGGSDNDTLTIFGSAGDGSTLNGQGGNDSLDVRGGTGHTLLGGAGDDFIHIRGGAGDGHTVNGQGDVDTLRVDRNSDLTVNSGSIEDDNAGTIVTAYPNIENLDVRGGADANTINVNSAIDGATDIRGAAGDDVINVLGGTGFSVFGGADVDTINVSGGSHTAFGGDGDDVINLNAGAADGNDARGGDGNDTININAGIHDVRGNDGNDIVNVNVGAGDGNFLRGNAGDDQFNLNAGVGHQVRGGDDNDLIVLNLTGDAEFAASGASTLLVSGATTLVNFRDVEAITINGDGTDNTLGIDFDVLPAELSVIEFNAAGGSDAINLSGTVNSIVHTAASLNDGGIFVEVNPAQSHDIFYTGLDPIVSDAIANEITLVHTNATDVIDITLTAPDTLLVDSDMSESMEFLVPANILRIDTDADDGSGSDDVVNINSFVASPSFTTEIRTLEGNDTVTIAAGDNLDLDTGDGDDTVIVDFATLSSLSALNLDGGLGTNTLELQNVDIDFNRIGYQNCRYSHFWCRV